MVEGIVAHGSTRGAAGVGVSANRSRIVILPLVQLRSRSEPVPSSRATLYELRCSPAPLRRRGPPPTRAGSPARRARRLAARVAAGETPLGRSRRARRMARALAQAYPDAHCELDFSTPLELAVATILSAQCTDKRVNEVTPALFAQYRTAADYAGADRAELEELIKPTGLLPEQGHRADRARRRAGRAVRRRAARHPGRAGHAARDRPQDRQRDPRQRVRRARHHGRHPLRPAGPPLGLDRRGRPGEDRARRRRADPEAGLDDAVAPGDLPRPPGLPRPQARLRGLPAGRGLPVLRAGPDRPGAAAALVKGPEAAHLLAMVGLERDRRRTSSAGARPCRDERAAALGDRRDRARRGAGGRRGVRALASPGRTRPTSPTATPPDRPRPSSPRPGPRPRWPTCPRPRTGHPARRRPAGRRVGALPRRTAAQVDLGAALAGRPCAAQPVGALVRAVPGRAARAGRVRRRARRGAGAAGAGRGATAGRRSRAHRRSACGCPSVSDPDGALRAALGRRRRCRSASWSARTAASR